MPSLNLRNVLRRDPDRPTLRQRAAALKTAATKAIRRPEQSTSPTANQQVDPHIALLPALRQAFAWTRDAAPFVDEPSSSPKGRAYTAVAHHCWGLSSRIIAMPSPATPAGLGALALALTVWAEGSIGKAENDGLDHERYPEERRLAAAVRAMMSVAGIDPLPGWVGFGDEPGSDDAWQAMVRRQGHGSLPAWALAGKSGPDGASEA